MNTTVENLTERINAVETQIAILLPGEDEKKNAGQKIGDLNKKADLLREQILDLECAVQNTRVPATLVSLESQLADKRAAFREALIEIDRLRPPESSQSKINRLEKKIGPLREAVRALEVPITSENKNSKAAKNLGVRLAAKREELQEVFAELNRLRAARGDEPLAFDLPKPPAPGTIARLREVSEEFRVADDLVAEFERRFNRRKTEVKPEQLRRKIEIALRENPFILTKASPRRQEVIALQRQLAEFEEMAGEVRKAQAARDELLAELTKPGK